MHATQFPISARTKLRPDQVALIGKKKYRRSVRYQVDTGSLSQAGNHVGLPHFAPRGGFKADKGSSGTGAVNKIISEQRSRGIAQNASGCGWSVGPENLRGRLVAVQLKHQAADEQP